jgi:hypothetical protein
MCGLVHFAVTAVKAIRSLRQWVYQTFRSDSLLHLVVIVTDQDVAANSEYVARVATRLLSPYPLLRAFDTG